jgi:hypothetical protein
MRAYANARWRIRSFSLGPTGRKRVVCTINASGDPSA